MWDLSVNFHLIWRSAARIITHNKILIDTNVNKNGHSVERIPSHITSLGIEL